MEYKIRIKLGALEIEYEGAEDYLKNELPVLIDKLMTINVPIEKEVATNSFSHTEDSAAQPRSSIEMSTNTIASKIGGKTCTELVIASSANLTLVKGKEKLQRKEILEEMKTATNFFKSSYNNNLSRALKTLVNDGKLIERTKDTFALSADLLKSLRASLHGH